MCLQTPGVRHFGDFPPILLNRKLVKRERRCLIFYFQVALVDPDGDIFPGQPSLAIKVPMFEFYEAMTINLAGKLCGIQGPREDLFRDGSA